MKVEYTSYIVSIWAFFLFLIGSVGTGWFVRELLTEDWPKYIRFALVIGSGVSVGSVLAYFTPTIQIVAAYLIALALVAEIGYWVWEMV